MLLSVKAERQKPLVAIVAIAAGTASIDRGLPLQRTVHISIKTIFISIMHNYFLTHKVRYLVDICSYLR